MMAKKPAPWCCYLDPKTGKACSRPARWTIYPAGGASGETQTCDRHRADLECPGDTVEPA